MTTRRRGRRRKLRNPIMGENPREIMIFKLYTTLPESERTPEGLKRLIKKENPDLGSFRKDALADMIDVYRWDTLCASLDEQRNAMVMEHMAKKEALSITAIQGKVDGYLEGAFKFLDSVMERCDGELPLNPNNPIGDLKTLIDVHAKVTELSIKQQVLEKNGLVDAVSSDVDRAMREIKKSLLSESGVKGAVNLRKAVTGLGDRAPVDAEYVEVET